MSAMWGSANHHVLGMRPVVHGPHGKGRRRCHCGCGGWSTHIGTANGLGMTYGCEWYVRRWVTEKERQRGFSRREERP